MRYHFPTAFSSIFTIYFSESKKGSSKSEQSGGKDNKQQIQDSESTSIEPENIGKSSSRIEDKTEPENELKSLRSSSLSSGSKMETARAKPRKTKSQVAERKLRKQIEKIRRIRPEKLYLVKPDSKEYSTPKRTKYKVIPKEPKLNVNY